MDRRPVAVSRERALLRSALLRWGLSPESSVDDILLVVSELLSNAVLYGTVEVVVLSVVGLQNEVRIEVDDRTPGTWPARACATYEDENGRGLLLVKALSSAWGISRNGALVWCTVPTGSAP